LMVFSITCFGPPEVQASKANMPHPSLAVDFLLTTSDMFLHSPGNSSTSRRNYA
jgi:hypothetical protein